MIDLAVLAGSDKGTPLAKPEEVVSALSELFGRRLKRA